MSEQKKSLQSGLSFVWGVVTGAVVGGISGLLFAPKKGKELRGDIKEGATKAIEASNQALQTVSQKTVEVAKVVEEKASGLVEEAKQKYEQLVRSEVKEATIDHVQAVEVKADENEQAVEVQKEEVLA